MEETAHSPRLIRFGTFEADLETEELRKNGLKLKLSGQPFQVLAILLERPGEVVTRETLQNRLWPDSFVDFDHNLNTAINKIREALSDSAESPRFVETLPRRGYRFIAPIDGSVRRKSISHQYPSELRADLQRLKRDTESGRAAVLPTVFEMPDSDAASIAAPTVRTGMPARLTGSGTQITFGLFTRHKKALLTVAALTIVTVTGLGYRAYRWLSSGSGSSVDSLAVLPFTNMGGDGTADYLSDGITESLIANLAHIPRLKVKSRNSVFRFKGKDADVQKAGSELSVSAIVSGRVTQHGDSVEVGAELTDVRDNTALWGQHYSGNRAEIISLQQHIAADIAERLRSKLSSSEKQQVTEQGTQNPEAYELYLKGRYSWNKRTPSDIANAISYFNQAIAKDPGYALAYSGLADAYAVLDAYDGAPREVFAKANAAARKAIELDATLAHPHAILTGNAVYYDWDFAGGEAGYKKALELDPNDATAHQWYGQELAYIGGRVQESLAEINRAHELDPVSPIISFAVGDVHISARQYDEAIVVCKRLAGENPTFAQAHACLFRAYWGKRMYPQVIEEWKVFGQLSGDWKESEFAAALENGFRSASWKRAITRGIQARQAQRKKGYLSAYSIARLYAELGQNDQAFRWLDTAYQERDPNILSLKTDFVLDSLRSDPRFPELVGKVGLPE